MAITSSQITIIDYNDITTSITPPQNPTLDQLWLDTSINPSILKRYNGSLWINSGIDLNDYPSVTGTISKVNLGLNINGEVIKTINANNLNITTPSSDGLYLTKDYIGFYKTSDMQWKSYIKSDGTFKFYGNSTNFVEWNGSSLTIRGLLNAGDIITGTLSADRIESNSLTVDKLNVGSGAVFSGNIFSGKTVTGSGGSTSELTNGTREIGSNLYTFSSGNSINNAPESAYIQIDLGEVCRLSQINTYWYSEDNRYYLYKIKYSTDGTSWIYAKGNSSNTGWVLSTVPISTDTGKINPTIDIFNIPISARYIRIFGNGNSVNTLNNLYEIEGFSTEQTSIVGDQISSGIIQSNNYNTTLGSYFNLNNGTFKLGGSLKPKLSWDGTDLNITGKINVLSGSNIEPGATNNYRYIQTDDPLPEQITFIRNSTAYSSDFKSVPNNKPRIENGIFGKAIMIEEGVTNLCPYSRAMDQWSYARCSVVLNAAKSFDSTLSANKIICDGNNDPSVWITKDFGSQIKNRTFTFSVFLWTDSGQPTDVTLFMYDFFSNPFSRKYELFQITTTPKRYSITYTMPSDAIGNIILFRIDPKDINPGAGSYIYADGIQIEEKPYATSFHESIRNPESITIPSDGITPYAGTIEMWLDVTDQTKRATIGNSSHRLIHIGRANDNNANGLVIGHDDNGFAAGLFNDSGVASSVAPIPNNSVLNGRHHFAVAWDATSLIFYIDGVQKGIINTPQLPTGFSPLIHIGCHPTSSTAFINSLIDNVRLSNYKRAEADILASATSGLPMKKDLFTVALLNFDTGIEWLNNGVLKTYNGVGWEDTATWGATAGTNLKNENGTVLGNVDILNSSSAYSVLSVPLDAELFSFNNNITGSKGTSPTGTTNVYTRRYAEDNFGYNCIAIESPTTNLLLNSMMVSTANWIPSNSGNLLLSTSSPLGSLPIGATGCLRTVVTGAMGYTTQAVTLSTSTQYTLSAWVFVPSYVVGTASISVWYSNSGWYNIAATTITERNMWVRKTLTFTSNSSFTSHIIGFGIGTGSVNDCVYVCMPQLEQKPFATSYTQSTRSDGRIIYSGLENDINWEKFSALMWIKRQYTGASQRIFSSWTKALFTVDVTTNILRYSYTNTSQQNVNSSLTLTDTNWHLVGLSVDKTNNKITFFKDNLFDEKTGITIGYTAAATPFTLGQLTSTDVSTPANMLFSNFVIFKNSVITTDYVKAVYAAQKPFYDLNNIIKVPKPSSVSITIGVA